MEITMSKTPYHHAEGGASILRAAAHELSELAQLEFLVDPHSDYGLALTQLQVWLLRLSDGRQPFTLGPRFFLDGLRQSFARINQLAKPKAGTVLKVKGRTA
jgi:hypothetical protein